MTTSARRRPARRAAWLSCCLAASLAHAPLGAQDADRSADEPAELAPVSVTGTRIAGVDPEHLPLSLISREQLEADGAFRLSETLRKLPWNNLGAQAQGFHIDGRSTLGAVDLRGLGANRTLVLLEGRRLALSPEANGEVVNLNNLPLAAVERVEVLRDGASAVYGSDAIGGVVNVVLRDDWSGIEASAGSSRSATGADEWFFNLAGGWQGPSSGFVGFVDALHRDPIEAIDAWRDPSLLVRRINPTGEPGTWAADDWFGDGSLVPGPWTPAADCPASHISRLPPWSVRDPATGMPTPPVPQGLCALEFDAGHEWSPQQDSVRALLRGDWQFDQGGRLYAQAIYSRLQSRAALTAGGDLPGGIGADNPLNPTWDPVARMARSPVTVYFGFFQLGPVQRDNDSDYLGIRLGGFTALPRGELDYGLQWDRETFAHAAGNLSLREALRGAIAAGRFNPFDALNDPQVVDELRYTQYSRSRTNMQSADLAWRADWPGRLAGEAGLATVLGMEWRHEEYRHVPDAEDVAQNVFRYVPGGIEADAGRDVWSVYGEASLQAGPTTRLILSARHDAYDSPDQAETTWKLSWSWDAAEALTLRAGWGQGFRAPSLLELHAPQVPGLAFAVIDTLRCRSSGIQPAPGRPPPGECFPYAVWNYQLANPELEPEHSVNWNAGLVWRPWQFLRLELDVWRIEIEDQIATPSVQEILDLEAAGLLPDGATVNRDAGGLAREVSRLRLNRPSALVEGIDFMADANFDGSDAGAWTLFSWWSFLTTYEVQTVPGGPVAGRVGGDEAPRWKSRSGLGWRRGILAADLTANGVDHFGTNVRRPEWWSFDVQVAWTVPWDAKLSFGARNLTDERSETLDVRHHEYDGRTWFARYRQQF